MGIIIPHLLTNSGSGREVFWNILLQQEVNKEPEIF